MTSAAPASTDTRLLALREAGAARLDAVGWHYIEVLAERTQMQNGSAQALLLDKLDQALDAFEARLNASAPQPAASMPVHAPTPSPLKTLLQDMGAPDPMSALPSARPDTGWRAESPRVRQFRQQLRKISVHKQVSQAMAMAPQNAGPINSHMLVLRSLGLMRDISGDYLNRFMVHLETLLCLDEDERNRLPTKKPAARPRKN